MKLNVTDRLIIDTVLPREGRRQEVCMARAIRQAVKFSDEEAKTLELRTGTDAQGKPSIFWDIAKDTQPDIELSPEQIAFISLWFKRFDEAGKFPESWLDTDEKFRAASANVKGQ